ncbi:unnamed protein product [Trichobilharzia szidati]|nr:unnamed protein product [Trichobilharzia szidati]
MFPVYLWATVSLICSGVIILFIVLFFKFRNKFSVALILMALIILLCTTNICYACCSKPEFDCYVLIGFCAFEDLLTIILCALIRRLKSQVLIVMAVLDVVLYIIGTVLYFLYKDCVFRRICQVYIALAGGFWNSAVCLAALIITDLLK